jgi:hypothetical protein
VQFYCHRKHVITRSGVVHASPQVADLSRALLLVQFLPSADERLEAEQQRVGSLENIVGQLEERMSELSQAAMAAPGISALELGGPAAELVVASNALRKEWKAATTELTTTRHILASLELEYKDARKQHSSRVSWGCLEESGNGE